MKRYKTCPCGGQPDLTTDPLTCACGKELEVLEETPSLMVTHTNLKPPDALPGEIWASIGPGCYHKRTLGRQGS
jgi:hypothetical protein